MAIDRKAAFSRMNLSRRLDQGDDERKRLQTNRRLESASIGRGGLRVLDGFIVILDTAGNEQMRLSTDGLSMEGLLQVVGEILVEGGGDIVVSGGGNIEIEDDGSLVATDADENRKVILNAGQIELGSVSPDETLGFIRADQSSGSLRLIGDDGVEVVALNDNIGLQSLAGGVAMTTGETGSAANLHQGASDQLINRSTSARRYKQDIEDLVVDPVKAFGLRPRIWRDRKEVERNPDTDRWHVGLVAEEVIDAGLGAFVEHTADGEPDYVCYDRLSIALLALAKDQERRLSDLETRVATLDGKEPKQPTVHETKLPIRKSEPDRIKKAPPMAAHPTPR